MKSLFFILILASFASHGQKLTYKGFPSLVWPKLYSVDYEKKTDELGEFEKPIFNSEVKALQGRTVVLPGYLVPFENGMKASVFMLSSLPLNACFFCGVGGPETAVYVLSSKEVTYTDKPVEIKGTLKLNDSDPDKLIYILENAEVLGEITF